MIFWFSYTIQRITYKKKKKNYLQILGGERKRRREGEGNGIFLYQCLYNLKFSSSGGLIILELVLDMIVHMPVTHHLTGYFFVF